VPIKQHYSIPSGEKFTYTKEIEKSLVGKVISASFVVSLTLSHCGIYELVREICLTADLSYKNDKIFKYF
jgi:hypothetical protein